MLYSSLKKVLFTLYIAILVAMAVATFVEPARGADYVSAHFYGSWWFILIWAMLAAISIIYFIRQHVRRAPTVALHASFIIILLGALLTHISSKQGTVHLRIGETTRTYTVGNEDGGAVPERLPFDITLNSFDIIYHEGTTSVADYVSTFTINDGGTEIAGQVSMNKIFSYQSIRLYQMSYDTDMRGNRLSINTDPWGIPVTYAGYALLFISLLWMLADPKGGFRRTLRALDAWQKTPLLVAMLFFSAIAQAQGSQSSSPQHTLPRATAEQFGRLYVMYNGRICPMQTLAIDFTKKLYGKSHYKDFTAEQVLTGFLFWPHEWEKEPVIRIKNGELRDRLQLPGYVSESVFFNRNMGGYILGPYVVEYYRGNNDKFHNQVADIDDRLQLVMDVHRGAIFKIFPYQDADNTLNWYSPADNLPETMEADRQLYIQGIMRVLYDEIQSGNIDTADELIRKMRKYQRVYGGSSLPSPTAVKAERLYNVVPFATILFIIDIVFGLLSLLWMINRGIRAAGPESDRRKRRVLRSVTVTLYSVTVLSFLALTLCLVLRWIIGGTVPMSNGYETMLLTAWLVLLLTIIACRRFKIVLSFGLLLSGFFLLVSHIGQMDPQITHIMPVLSSPLLGIHVSLIMMSFALLSLTFICSVTALITHAAGKHRKGNVQLSAVNLQNLSLLFLYPAIALLGAGIFVGAIWANVSWGTYWSWDPKEVWALITFMVYAIAIHPQTVTAMRRPLTFHIFMAAAFLTILMTYFGVNYVLGGMHSYA